MQVLNSQKIEPIDGCIATAVGILGKKWTALILRDLIGSPKGFCELMRSVGNINPRTLSQRLSELEHAGIILTDNSRGYSLTKKGEDLMPILRQMAAWGNKYHP